MPVKIVIGAQWGDEGKGKIVDYLAEDADLVVRFNGGPNAGHTVNNKYGEFRLHQVPVGIFNPEALSIIGGGTVIDPEIFTTEINDLKAGGVSLDKLKISSRAHLIMPWHVMLDKAEENYRGSQAIGTTKKGIGPAFADKVDKKGIRVGDLWEIAYLRKRLELIWLEKKEWFTG